METNKIYIGDAGTILSTLPDNSVDCCVTSPPYFGLRNYDVAGQIGLEDAPKTYVQRLMEVFNQVRRVLKPSGTFWLNIGDSYAGSGRGKGDINHKGVQPKVSHVGDKFDKPYKLDGYKNKDLIGVPWMLAFALRNSGWYLRQDIIWHKPNPMPEPVTDRCTKAHEHIFLFAKSARYYFDYEAILEPYAKPLNRWSGNNLKASGQSRWAQATDQNIYRNRNVRPNPDGRHKRDVWTVPTRPFKGAHFATFPPDLIRPCVLAGCPPNGIVLDPFFGAGTTGLVALQSGRNYIGVELNSEYVKIAEERLQANLPFECKNVS
jgi:DNA modification methylase